VLFAAYISYQDLTAYFTVGGISYTLLLPTCVYGGVFFLIVFILSATSLKK